MLIEKYANYLEKWIVNQVKKAKAKGIIFGLSGGVDSAVIAGIAKTILPNNHLALVMHINNSELDLNCTKTIIETFQLNAKNIDLLPIVNQMANTLAISKQTNLNAFINLKARIRTISLYGLSQKYNYLVCGTSNYDEWITGYFTKYGDSACDLAPLRNCLKQDIYKLAKHYQVPSIIIKRQPTAGLYPNQTDASDLGFDYNDLDAHLLKIKKLPNKQLIRFNSLHASSQHKRKLPPAAKGYSKLK